MSFMDKMKDLVGIGEEYEDELEVSQEEIDAYKREIIADERAHSELPTSAPAAPVSFNEIAKPMPRASAAISG